MLIIIMLARGIYNAYCYIIILTIYYYKGYDEGWEGAATIMISSSSSSSWFNVFDHDD